MDELPEWSLPYTDNYTGPLWSDGRFQASVAQGKSQPKTKLDKLSKAHDRSYALSGGYMDRLRADLVYYRDSRGMSLAPSLIGAMPLVGNQVNLVYQYATTPGKLLGDAIGYVLGLGKMGANVSSPTDSVQGPRAARMPPGWTPSTKTALPGVGKPAPATSAPTAIPGIYSGESLPPIGGGGTDNNFVSYFTPGTGTPASVYFPNLGGSDYGGSDVRKYLGVRPSGRRGKRNKCYTCNE
jgi:hypothetical protein